MVVLAITVVMQLEGSFSSSYPPIMENTVRELRAGEGTSAVRYLYRYHEMAINALHGTGTDRRRGRGPYFSQILVQVPPSPSELVLPGPCTSTVQYK